MAWENWDINFFLLLHALQLKVRCSSPEKFSKLAEVAWWCACLTIIVLRGDMELAIDLAVPQISYSMLGLVKTPVYRNRMYTTMRLSSRQAYHLITSNASVPMAALSIDAKCRLRFDKCTKRSRAENYSFLYV